MGGKGGGGSSTSTSTAKPPKYLETAYKDIIGKAGDVFDLPLNQYNGPMLAGFSPDQMAAFSNIRGANGAYQPYFDKAGGYLDSANQDIWGQIPEFNEETISKYYNPYENDVVNTTLDDLRRFNAGQQEDLTGSAIRAGAWGGSGAEDAKMNLAGEQTRGAASTIAGLRSSGYNTAAGLLTADRQAQLDALKSSRSNALQSAGIAGGMGNDATSNILKAASAQLGSGLQQQALAQQEINIPYQQFQEQQQYPYQQLQYLTNLISAISGGAGGTTTSSQPKQGSNALSDILGVAGTVAPFFLRDGGRVGKAYGGGIVMPHGSAPTADMFGMGGIPMDFMKASMSAPAAPTMSDMPDDTMDKWLSNIGLIGQSMDLSKKFPHIGAAPAAFGDAMNRGAGISGGMRSAGYAARGGFGPYADGGAVGDEHAAVFGSTAKPAGFSASVPGTPLFSFDPAKAAGRGTTIASRIPVKAAADPNAAAKTRGMGDWYAAFMTNPMMRQQLFGQMGVNPITKQHPDMLNTMFSGFYGGLNADPDKYSEYDLDSYFSRGGIAGRRRCAGGGGIMGNPYARKSPIFMPQDDMTSPEGILKYLDYSAGYVPTDSKFQKAGLSTPSVPMAKGDGENPDQERAQGMAALLKNIGGNPEVAGKEAYGPPAPGTKAAAGIAGGHRGFSQRLDDVMNDPAKLAMMIGSASMIGNPGWSFAENLGSGLRQGISAYAGAKKADRDANAEAQKLLLDIRKEQADEDYRNKTLDQPEYVSVEGDDGIHLMNKKTGEMRDTGMKPKNKTDVSAKDIGSIEEDAIGRIANAYTKPDKKGKSTIRPEIWDMIPNRNQALAAAAQAYQKTNNADAAAQAYLQAAGLDPDNSEYDPGADNSALGRLFGAEPDRDPSFASKKGGKGGKGKKADPAGNADAILQQARDAIAKGKDPAAVKARLQKYGIDPGGL